MSSQVDGNNKEFYFEVIKILSSFLRAKFKMSQGEILNHDYKPIYKLPSKRKITIEDKIENIFTIEFKVIAQRFLVVFFLVAFLVSIGYWFYEVYYVYESNLSLKTVVEIGKVGIHSFVAFQAAILSFALLYASAKII